MEALDIILPDSHRLQLGELVRVCCEVLVSLDGEHLFVDVELDESLGSSNLQNLALARRCAALRQRLVSLGAPLDTLGDRLGDRGCDRRAGKRRGHPAFLGLRVTVARDGSRGWG